MAASLGTLLILAVGALFQESSSSESTFSKEKATQLTYTRHAKCRMDCRFLDKDEVIDVIVNGKINHKKSSPKARPCPVVVKEKRTADRQMARVVYGRCPGKLKVITVIDLDTDHACQCQ